MVGNFLPEEIKLFNFFRVVTVGVFVKMEGQLIGGGVAVPKKFVWEPFCIFC